MVLTSRWESDFCSAAETLIRARSRINPILSTRPPSCEHAAGKNEDGNGFGHT